MWSLGRQLPSAEKNFWGGTRLKGSSQQSWQLVKGAPARRSVGGSPQHLLQFFSMPFDSSCFMNSPCLWTAIPWLWSFFLWHFEKRGSLVGRTIALTNWSLQSILTSSTILNSPCPCLPPLLVYMVCLVGWVSGHPVFLGPCQCTAPFTIILGQRNIKKWPLWVTCISEWFTTVLATHCLKIVSFHFSWHWYGNFVFIFITDMGKIL